MKRLLIMALLCGCAATPDNYLMGEQFVGVRYLSDPLGEGFAPDTDPLIRFDAFDCTTFVETVLAGGDIKRLTKIRYKDGEVGFLTRNHFIEVDWLPNNAELIENVSAQYGVTDIRKVVIDKRGWFKRVHGIDTDFEPQMTQVEYLPYSNIGAINISEPMIVLFITGKSEKSAKIGTDIAVVHMGLLLPGGVLRHASSAYGRVIDVDFKKYIAQRAAMKNNLGIALVKIK